MVYVVTIANVLDEDSGEVGAVHIQVNSEVDAKALVEEIIFEEDANPADFTIVATVPDWECVGHGDGALCAKPRLN